MSDNVINPIFDESKTVIALKNKISAVVKNCFVFCSLNNDLNK